MADTPKKQQANLLAGTVGCDPRTALKWLNHEPVNHALHLSLQKAAAELGVDRGPAPGSAPDVDPPPEADSSAGAAE